MSELDYIKSIYQDFQNGTNIDDVLQLAANDGYVFLEKCFAKAKSGSFELDALLLPSRFLKYKTLTAARQMGHIIIPEWFEYNAEKDYFTYSEDKLTDALIDHYGIKKIDGRYTMNGNGASKEDIEAAILKSLSIVRAKPGQLVYSVFKNLSVKVSQQDPEQEPETEEREDGVASYMAKLMSQEIGEFSRASETKTGFPRFDQLAGGIFPGLYVMAAISSLGKTTFIHQMADQMAAAGKHVLFFSLEMSRLEMVSKSISRKMAQTDYSNALTSLKIRRGTTSALMQRATKEYAESVGDRLNVIEGGFDTTVSFIGEYTQRYIEKHNTRPVVIVDYLQIVQGAQKNTLRESTDYNVVELKRMTRALDVPVIVISSVNRGNYLLPVDFESIKESGGIEYTADVVLGLQLACLDEPLFDKEKQIKEKRERVKAAKGENPREVKLVCLKNRYGSPDWAIEYKYYPQYDLFEEQDPAWMKNGMQVVDEPLPFQDSRPRRRT